jgi:hypothetical protein
LIGEKTRSHRIFFHNTVPSQYVLHYGGRRNCTAASPASETSYTGAGAAPRTRGLQTVRPSTNHGSFAQIQHYCCTFSNSLNLIDQYSVPMTRGREPCPLASQHAKANLLRRSAPITCRSIKEMPPIRVPCIPSLFLRRRIAHEASPGSGLTLPPRQSKTRDATTCTQPCDPGIKQQVKEHRILARRFMEDMHST